tara:strand:- start:38 stop:523 length:486 start_codon:yes stop_codon:yes gene_type:complete
MGLENWKDIPSYIGYYQVSDKGNVRSLDRYVNGINKGKRLLRGKSKPLQKHPDGYYQIALSKYGVCKTFKNYQLVACAFLNFKPLSGLVIDHIDNNPKNNNLSNLQIITHKENTQKDKKNLGVSYHKYSGKWRVYNYLNKKQVSLGYYETEAEANKIVNLW